MKMAAPTPSNHAETGTCWCFTTCTKRLELQTGSNAPSACWSDVPSGESDLFLETLKDIYHAEKQILRALPKMAKAANSDELRAAFEKHLAETEEQVDRVEQVFQIMGESAKAKPCDAIMGLVEEGQEVMQEFKGSDALDAGLLAAAQAVEHYEISRYGTLKAWAEQMISRRRSSYSMPH